MPCEIFKQIHLFKCTLLWLIAEYVLKNAKFQDKFQSYLPMFYPGHLVYLKTLVFLPAY